MSAAAARAARAAAVRAAAAVAAGAAAVGAAAVGAASVISASVRTPAPELGQAKRTPLAMAYGGDGDFGATIDGAVCTSTRETCCSQHVHTCAGERICAIQAECSTFRSSGSPSDAIAELHGGEVESRGSSSKW